MASPYSSAVIAVSDGRVSGGIYSHEQDTLVVVQECGTVQCWCRVFVFHRYGQVFPFMVLVSRGVHVSAPYSAFERIAVERSVKKYLLCMGIRTVGSGYPCQVAVRKFVCVFSFYGIGLRFAVVDSGIDTLAMQCEGDGVESEG